MGYSRLGMLAAMALAVAPSSVLGVGGSGRGYKGSGLNSAPSSDETARRVQAAEAKRERKRIQRQHQREAQLLSRRRVS
jgi:hypothetical protein